MPPTRSSAARLGGVVSVVFVALMGGYLLVYGWIASGVKPMWMDEMLAYTLIIDPSPSHMLDTLSHGADGGFPLYYLIGWCAAHVAPPTEWHLRMISSLLEATALGLWYGLLRRTYGVLPAMLTTTIGMGGSTLLLYQDSELRFYTLLLLGAVVALLGYDGLLRRARERGRPSWGFLALNGAGHAMLVLTHPFGVAYSFVISVAAIAAYWWWRPGRFLPGYLVSCACGDAAFLWWFGRFVEQSRVVAGHTAIPVPSMADFFRIYLQVAPLLYYEDRTKAWAARTFLPVSHHLGAVAVTLFLALLVAGGVLGVAWKLLGKSVAQVEDVSTRPADGHLIMVAVAFAVVPAVVWVTSHLGKSLFLHRYFIPSVLAFTIFYARGFAEMARLVAQRGVWTAWRRDYPARTASLAAAAGLVFAGVYVVWPLAAACTAPDGFTELQGRIACLPSVGVPVVIITGSEFWEFGHYAKDDRFWFVLDREVALDPRNGLPSASEFALAAAFQRGYPGLHIARSEDFLARFLRFVVEDAPDSLWYARRLRGNPAFRATELPGRAPGCLLMTRVGPEAGDSTARGR